MASKHTIDDSKFSVKYEGVKAIIVYPALTTPALVDSKGKLTVIIAVHQDYFNKLEKLSDKKKIKPLEEVSALVAVKLHAHLFLMPWGKNYIDADKSKELSEINYRSHFEEITSNKYLIYQSHQAALKKYTGEGGDKAYWGWYLGPSDNPLFGSMRLEAFKNEGASEVYIRTPGTPKESKAPLGELHEEAMKVYHKAGFKHYFQLEFNDFITAKPYMNDPSLKGIYELAWVWGDATGIIKKSSSYEKSSDTVLLQNYEANLNGDEKNQLLKPNVQTSPCQITPDSWKPLESKTLNMYRLLNPGAKSFPTGKYINGYPKEILNMLPAMRQEGARLMLSRHPVFICSKEHLDIGVVGDLHISTRQSLYKLTNCQVIPGAKVEDSPYIGKISNEFSLSARDVMDRVSKSSDILVIVGDIIDYDKNIYPKKIAHKIKKTGHLWNYIEHEKHSTIYPKRIDGIIMLELVLKTYDSGVPVFLITGNHEGYEYPYGISPRVMTKKVNEGIPCDHNLTIYEAALLYGKTYDQCTWFNFSEKILPWYFQVFSPWVNIILTHSKYNYVFFCWGNDEGYVKSFLEGGGTLPRSYEAITDYQLKLLMYAGAQSEEKKNIVFSHFTYVSYDPSLPLKTEDTGAPYAGEIIIGSSRLTKTGDIIGSGGKVVGQIKHPATRMIGRAAKAIGFGFKLLGETESAFCTTNRGSFIKNLQSTFALLGDNNIHYTVSGHAHRGCVYSIEGGSTKFEWARPLCKALAKEYRSLAWDIWKHRGLPQETDFIVSPVLPSNSSPLPQNFSLPQAKTISIVTGSAGPLSTQNMEGEFGGIGLDKPQGMVFSPGSHSVTVIRSSGAKPRLAALAGFLLDVGRIFPFSDESYLFENKHRGRVETTWWDGAFYIKMNPEWMEIFGGVPFDWLKIHAVKNDDGEGVTNEFTLHVESTDISSQKVFFAEKSSDFKEILSGLGGFSNINFFLSMHFSGKFLKHTKYLDYYDLTSPWCFPIKLSTTWLLNRHNFEIKEQELPDFTYYRKFTEFKKD